MSTQPTLQQQSQLASLLEQQLESIRHNREILDDVKALISQNDNAGLLQLLEQRPIDLSGLESMQSEQHQLLQSWGFGDDETALKQCAEACTSETLYALYETLEAELKALREGLMINDLLIRKNQQRVRQSISLLSGRIHETETSTYSRQGATATSGTPGRSLAQA